MVSILPFIPVLSFKNEYIRAQEIKFSANNFLKLRFGARCINLGAQLISTHLKMAQY